MLPAGQPGSRSGSGGTGGRTIQGSLAALPQRSRQDLGKRSPHLQLPCHWLRAELLESQRASVDALTCPCEAQSRVLPLPRMPGVPHRDRSDTLSESMDRHGWAFDLRRTPCEVRHRTVPSRLSSGVRPHPVGVALPSRRCAPRQPEEATIDAVPAPPQPTRIMAVRGRATDHESDELARRYARSGSGGSSVHQSTPRFRPTRAPPASTGGPRFSTTLLPSCSIRYSRSAGAIQSWIAAFCRPRSSKPTTVKRNAGLRRSTLHVPSTRLIVDATQTPLPRSKTIIRP